jgi:formylglycine-generating enzyme required for sulfatase activity
MRLPNLMLAVAAAAGCAAAEPPATDAARPVDIRSASGVEMVLVPGGWFEMGSDKGQPDEGPVHRVWVDSFVIDKHEVTQAQFAALQISDPSTFRGDRLPVERQTWIDAVRFCTERSIAEKLEPCYDEGTLACNFSAPGYRLPTEAEWEYAARAGAATAYPWGADARSATQFAWTSANAGQRTHDVGTRRPNAWGLFDMIGNVGEWVHDYYGADYYRGSPDRNPRGPATGEYRVIRGGAWDSPEEAVRVSRRTYSASVDDGCVVTATVGFRCARPPLPHEISAAVPARAR